MTHNSSTIQKKKKKIMSSKYSFNKCLSSNYAYSSVIFAGNIALNKTDINPHPGRTYNEEGNSIKDLGKCHVKKAGYGIVYGIISILLHIKRLKDCFIG